MVMSARLQHGRSFFIGMSQAKAHLCCLITGVPHFTKGVLSQFTAAGDAVLPGPRPDGSAAYKGEHLLWQESFLF